MSTEEGLIKQIGKKYKKYAEAVWVTEKPRVTTILKAITTKVNERYEILDPINIGGTGIVLKVRDRNLGIPRALKFPRPLAGKEPLLTSVIKSEIDKLIESAHENIVSIYYKDQIIDGDLKWPFYVMEYIENADDGKEFIIKLGNSAESDFNKYRILIKVIQQVVEGLRFVHSREMIHCDIKLENILISPTGKAKLTDFGSARLLIPGTDEETQFVVTEFYAHPKLRELKSETSEGDPDRMGGKIKRSLLRKKFDLYALGKNLLRVLHDIRNENINTSYIPPYERRYLELMACRMLDGFNEANECCLKDLPRNGYEEIRYESIEEVITDIKKITGEYAIHQEIKELDHHFPQTIQITSSGITSFTERVAKVLESAFFRRLAGVSQLGFILQIYPSASHSRLEHVLGTFANVARYCDALWNDPINPFFRQIMTDKDIKMVLLSALFHDIGQYPLAHDFEGAENDIFSHSQIGKLLLSTNEMPESNALKELIRIEWDVEINKIIELLDAKVTDYSKPFKMRLLHSLIDGPIDADKLDYLVRDSNHLNVPYGKSIDLERLLRCLTVILTQRTADEAFISLGIHEKGKVPAESIAFARYAMFSSVYWHHTSRSAKSMLHRAVWETLEKGRQNGKKENDLKRALIEEIMQQVHTSFTLQNKEGLFNEQVILAETPQLALSDYQMLAWLAKLTSPEGKNLLQMICERKLFKRLKVLSHQREGILWEKLIRLRKKGAWNELLRFQNKVQEILMHSIETRENKVFQDIKNKIKERQILFLVDIPVDSKGSSVGLFFSPEYRMHGPVSGPVDNPTMEDSIVWSSLATNFLESAGKIRVFCHPEIIEPCARCFGKTKEIEGAMTNALEQIGL